MKLNLKENEFIYICHNCGEIHQVKEKELEGKYHVSPTFIENCNSIKRRRNVLR